MIFKLPKKMTKRQTKDKKTNKTKDTTKDKRTNRTYLFALGTCAAAAFDD